MAMVNMSNTSRAYKPPSQNTVGAGADPENSRIQHDLPSRNRDPAHMLRQAAGRIPHIGIVGAGVAGLRCAEVLLSHGAKVTVFEGRNRVGGRFCQGKVGEHVVDL
jgi:NADPH-dependent 2,4-dienoyl-CoA reductase/sulfur reductase-like enzyme